MRIIQISATSCGLENYDEPIIRIFGLGNDGLVYIWGVKEAKWFLAHNK